MKLDYDPRCNKSDSNPVFLTRSFQYRVENFFKEIIKNGKHGKLPTMLLGLSFKLEIVHICISRYGQIMFSN